MRGWITLHILIHTEESAELDKLGIKVNQDNLVYTKHNVQISNIFSVSTSQDGETLISTGNDYLVVLESEEEVMELIEENK
jgi:tricorn protease-like protein